MVGAASSASGGVYGMGIYLGGGQDDFQATLLCGAGVTLGSGGSHDMAVGVGVRQNLTLEQFEREIST